MAMKKDRITGTKDMLEFFDDSSDMLSLFGSKTKDYTLIINTLELFVEQMKITREVSQQIKRELSEFKEEEFTKEAMKRLVPKIKPMQKELQRMRDSGFEMMLFALPDKKGRRFFEIMAELENAGKLPITDLSKRAKIDAVIDSLEQYILEIKEISKPFIPAKINKNQTIIFKVMFKYRKGVWRKIELKATDTLEDLHDAIQGAIGWDNDHLYSFFMDNNFHKGDFDAEYTCPYEPEGRKTADKAQVGIFGFKKGQKFAYLFDFGDSHRFEVEIADFGIIDKGKSYPVFLESKGKSPEQYPNYDE